MSPDKGLVLAVHPTSHGFGWILFEGPLAPVTWSIASARGAHRDQRCVKRFKELLDRYQPYALILESYSARDSRRRDRIRNLAQIMRGLATSRDMDVLVYGREEIGAALTGDAGATRHAIAQAVAVRMPFLEPALPKPRKLWDSEHWRQPLFDAAALGITHYMLTDKSHSPAKLR